MAVADFPLPMVIGFKTHKVLDQVNTGVMGSNTALNMDISKHFSSSTIILLVIFLTI
jgi:hypothetical protein